MIERRTISYKEFVDSYASKPFLIGYDDDSGIIMIFREKKVRVYLTIKDFPYYFCVKATDVKENKELFRLARRFEGIPRQFGVHASGILVTPTPITDNFPLRKDTKTGVMVTLWDKDEIEEFNGIKFDILGLNTLTIIRETLSIIDEKLTMNDLYAAVNVNEPEIYKIIECYYRLFKNISTHRGG